MTREDELKLMRVSDYFNELSFEQRGVASDYGIMIQIRELILLKVRIDKQYKNDIKFINDRIKRLLKDIKA